MRRKLFNLAAVLSLEAVLAFITAAVWQRTRGVKAIITNVGHVKMTDVRVRITGRQYAIGDLNRSESRTLYLNPSGESHIVLGYTNADGTSAALSVDCYFENGYSGEIAVDVADGNIVRVVNKTKI